MEGDTVIWYKFRGYRGPEGGKGIQGDTGIPGGTTVGCESMSLTANQSPAAFLRHPGRQWR